MKYKAQVNVKLRSLPNISDYKRRDLAQAIKDTALTVLGKKSKHRFHVNDEIARLSKQQQEMRLKIENVTDNTTKNSLRKDSKNDSSRMFRVIKEQQRQKPKIPLLIKTETRGFTISEKEQVENYCSAL